MPEAAQPLRVADIVVDSRQGGGDRLWTYRVDGPASPGDAFLVPLGPRAVLGIAVDVRQVEESNLGFPVSQLRGVLNRVQGLELPEPLLELVRLVADEYLCPLPTAMSAAMPPGAKERLSTTWSLTGKAPDPDDLPTRSQLDLLQLLQEMGGNLAASRVRKLSAANLRTLRLLRAKGFVEQVVTLEAKTKREARPPLYELTQDGDAIATFLATEAKKKPAQALTLMRLQGAERSRLTAAEIRAISNVTDQTVKALVASNLLVKADEREAGEGASPPEPNPRQAVAISAVVEAIRSGKHQPFLLYGVTGSGKTEVFLRSAAEALRLGRQVLYLVPEIALATQVIGRLRERFGQRVAVVHSELSATERLETWMRIRSGQTPVVLGARSALFAPLSDLGLVIVDEEHEGAYKQESAPRYHARRLAKVLGERHGCPVVLGSATPSVESFEAAQEGELVRLDLPERTASAKLPEVHIVDLAEGFRKRQPALLSPELITRVDEALRRGEQAIVFLNRRAYAPFLLCRECGHQFSCPRCAVSLALSRKENRLRCHHCGYNAAPPDLCPSCGGTKLAPVGVGTEKVEEALGEAFPGISIARLDRDVAQRRGALEDVLTRFRTGEHRILVGTQMVAKGLDFPNVTVVGVVLADVSLNLPDFRASERTFQLLSQVAGRAGRGHAPGHVVVQTFNPNHLAVECARDHDYERFFTAICDERRLAAYPPFVKLVNVTVTSDLRSEAEDVSAQVADAVEDIPEIIVLGPVNCAIERIQGRWRRHVLLKLPVDASVKELGAKLAEIPRGKSQVTIDVDPYSLV